MATTVSPCGQLWRAISCNDLQEVQKLLFPRSGGNIDLNEPYGVNVHRSYHDRYSQICTRTETENTTYLLHACLVSSPVLVSALVKAGANVNDSGNVMAKQYIDKSTVKQIYSRQYNATPLILAVIQRDMELVKKLLHRCGADVNARNDEGLAPLHFIVHVPLGKYKEINCEGSRPKSTDSEGNLEKIASLLLTAGAAVDTTDKDGQTPLYHAALTKDVGTAQLLLQHQARVAIPNKTGLTPLHISATRCYAEMCEILLSGADSSTVVNLAANDGATSLHTLIEAPVKWLGEDMTILKLFIEKGADLTAQKYGLTPLHLVAHGGLLNTVKVLIEAGADINTETPNTGLTPLDMAEHEDMQHIVDYLTARQEGDTCEREKNKREESSVEQEEEEEETQQTDTPVKEILGGAVGGFEQVVVIKEEGKSIEE